MDQKIKAMFIFEVLGKPPEHLKEALNQLIDKLNELPGIKVENSNIHEPKPLEDKNAKDLFTTFAEVDINSDNFNNLLMVVFNLLPSHVEIIDPGEIRITNNDLNDTINELVAKLHKYDEIAKAVTIEKTTLMNMVRDLQEKVNKLEDEKKEKS